jgi:uncharacterized membrane protein HdeD (DUF308 family)
LVDIKWPSAVVALGIFLVLGGIVITAIVKYDTPDEAMKVFAGLWGALGAGVGLLFAYFFTRGPLSEAKEMARDAKDTADSAMSMAKEIDSKMASLR